jgi:hypothetical protein
VVVVVMAQMPIFARLPASMDRYMLCCNVPNDYLPDSAFLLEANMLNLL